MQYFDWNGKQVIWRNHGETVVVEPWGPDSLRVRAVLMGDVRDDRFALLDATPSGDVEFTLKDEEHALLRNGKITAKMDVCGWKRRVRLTFVNQKGEVLLQETDGENALVLQARKFEPILGGDCALTATFVGPSTSTAWASIRRNTWTGRAAPWSWPTAIPRPACP